MAKVINTCFGQNSTLLECWFLAKALFSHVGCVPEAGQRVLLACTTFEGQGKKGVSKERMFSATFSNLGN